MIKALIQKVKLERPRVSAEDILLSISKVLSTREMELLSLRLPWSQVEVAKKWGLTKERIRAIEAKAIEKILVNISTHGIE